MNSLSVCLRACRKLIPLAVFLDTYWGSPLRNSLPEVTDFELREKTVLVALFWASPLLKEVRKRVSLDSTLVWRVKRGIIHQGLAQFD